MVILDRTEYVENKQDLNGTRTAQNIEQKYNLGAINNIIKTLKDNQKVLETLGLDLSSLGSELTTTQEDLAIAKRDIQTTNTTLNNFVTATTSTLSNMQSEIDGSITTYFHVNIPTMNNYPVTEWTQSEYNKHLGDLYYDTNTGYVYRFYVENNVYGWLRITDTDVTQALAIANAAQDTADNKRRVFLVQPEPPYDSGDLWVNSGKLYVCQISRATGEYQTNDFITDFDYTDDTYARAVEEELSNSIEVVNGRVTRVEQSNDEFKIQVESSISSIQNETNQVQETIRNMSYSFGTNDFRIASSEDPTNLRMNNSGVKIYNLSTLISIFNKNGTGIDKLIVVKSIQFQNILLKKRQITRPDTNQTIDVISGYWLVNLIETLHDLEV